MWSGTAFGAVTSIGVEPVLRKAWAVNDRIGIVDVTGELTARRSVIATVPVVPPMVSVDPAR